MGLLELYGRFYLIVIDYYSRWIESNRLDNLSSESVVYVLKEISASHGSPIPGIITSDNSPQFSAATFRQFATSEFSAALSIERRSRTGGAYVKVY